MCQTLVSAYIVWDSCDIGVSITPTMSQQPLIIIVGATGRTGGSIVNALVKSGNFVRLLV